MLVQLLLFRILTLSVATSAPTNEDQPDLSLAILLANATNHFAVNVLKALPRDESAFFSPLSVASVLAMAYPGAGGSTFVELKKALGIPHANMLETEFLPAFKQMFQALNNSSGREYALNLAIKALTGRHFDIYEDYINAIREYFGIELDQVDFKKNGETIKNDVNNWINEKSNGKIPSMLDSPPDPLTVMLLLNAIYFKAAWKEPFHHDDTKPGIFYNSGTTDGEFVLMMFDIRNASYTHSDELNCKALELPYNGDRLSMLFVLPDARDGLEELVQNLTSENLLELVENLQETSAVYIKIPTFKLEHTYDLENILPNIGIVKSFDRNEANFTYISSEDIYISKLLHKAYVRVDEEGTEASAATVVQFATLSALIVQDPETTFYVDRPFLFGIQDKLTKQFLFLGCINKL